MEEVVHDIVTLDGMREVKVVSDHDVSAERMMRFVPGACFDSPPPVPSPNTAGAGIWRGAEMMSYVKVRCYQTAALSLFYGEVTFPLRGALELRCEGWDKPRRFGVWRLMQDDGLRVSEVIEHLSDWFFAQTRRAPHYVFMRRLPRNVECGMQVGDLVLLEAEWALDSCVMVGG